MTKSAAARSWRPLTAVVVTALVMLAATSCGGSTDEPGGDDISSGSRHVNLIAYATPKPGFDVVIPAFRRTEAGRDIGFSQSYGPSGDQSRKVARRVPADVVNVSVQPDITRLVDAGVVDEDWQQREPNGSVPFGSVVAFVVRKGNPKSIHGWDDLLRPGVQVITPNPGSSGSAKWNLLAPYAVHSDGGSDHQAGLDYIAELIRDHVTVIPKSGREATTAFEQGQGDVLISYENEAIMLDRADATASPDKQVEYFVPAETFRIENPVAVVNTTSDESAARDFVDYLFTDEAQVLWAEQGFRPVMPSAIAATTDLFPGEIDTLWTIDELGGWDAVDAELFGPDGAITEIFDTGGRQ